MDSRTYIILLLFGSIFWTSFLSAQERKFENETLKVMTYNIHHGVNNNGIFDIKAIAEVIVAEDPDFVALQEVDSVIQRSGNMDLTKVLGKETGMWSVFGKATTIDNGFYGVALLSKHPILSFRNVGLPFQKNEEPRTALEITSILPSGDTISIIGTHLDYKAKDHYRMEQIQKINTSFSTNKYPTILAGDINDRPDSEALKLLEMTWTPTYNKVDPAATFPSQNPEVKIDYVLYLSKFKWQTLTRKVIDNSLDSDHRPYVVILKRIR